MKKQSSRFGWLIALLPLFFINVAYASLYKSLSEEKRVWLQPGTSFHSIENYGNCDIIINIGPTEGITIKGNPEDVKLVDTRVENGVLKFNIKNNQKGWNIRTRNIVIQVTATQIKALRQIGSGTIKVDDALGNTGLELEVNGSGDIVARALSATDIAATITGSGDISLAGTAKNAHIQINGSGNFNGRNLTIDNASVKVVGSGDTYVKVNHSLSANVTGSGNIRYSGSVKNVTTNKTGSGSITKY